MGIIEKGADGTADITAKTRYENLNPKTGVKNIEYSDVKGKGVVKDIYEDSSGLKKTIEKIAVKEDFNDKQIRGAYGIFNQQLNARMNRYGNRVIESETATRGGYIETKKSGGIRLEAVSPYNERASLTTTELRKPGFREADLTFEKKLPSNEPEWLFEEKPIQYSTSTERKINILRIDNKIYVEEPASNVLKATTQSMKFSLPKAEDIRGAGEVKLSVEPKPQGSLSTTSISKVGVIPKQTMLTGQAERFNLMNAEITPERFKYASVIKGTVASEGVSTGASSLNRVVSGMTFKPGTKEKTPQKQKISVGSILGTATATDTALTTSTIQQLRTETITTPRKIEIPRGVPRPKINQTPKIIPGIFKVESGDSNWRPKLSSGEFKLPKEKLRYRKQDKLKVTPIQADVSKWYYGKVTNPKPTRALLSRATISVPSAESLRRGKG